VCGASLPGYRVVAPSVPAHPVQVTRPSVRTEHRTQIPPAPYSVEPETVATNIGACTAYVTLRTAVCNLRELCVLTRTPVKRHTSVCRYRSYDQVSCREPRVQALRYPGASTTDPVRETTYRRKEDEESLAAWAKPVAVSTAVAFTGTVLRDKRARRVAGVSTHATPAVYALSGHHAV